MQTIEIQAEIDARDENRIRVPPGYAHRWARVAVTLPDRVATGDAETSNRDVPAPIPRRPLRMGLFRGQIQMAEDFNDPLPDSFWTDGNP